MKAGGDNAISRCRQQQKIQEAGLSWILIAGGVFLTTVSIQIGCKLKQAFDTRKSSNNSNNLPNRPTSRLTRLLGKCPLHADMFCIKQENDRCCHYLSGVPRGMVEIKQPQHSPCTKESDFALPLVTSPQETGRENGAMWVSSPDCRELPRKIFYHSNSSESPCGSESGSDIFCKREVIYKLRQQLKQRDEMMLEMQAKITDLQTSAASQISLSTHLQSQLDLANKELFDNDREIQKLRKVIADHWMEEVQSPLKQQVSDSQWVETRNSAMNGFCNDVKNMELKTVLDKVKAAVDGYDVLNREVRELREAMEHKDLLLQNYKQQQMEFGSVLKELQQRMVPQAPTIL